MAETLESRELFAGFNVAGTTLQVSLGSNESVAITSSGSTYNFALAAGTWSGTDGGGASGSGAASLVATAASFTSVTVDDTGTGNTVAFNYSNVNLYTSNFTVTLDGGNGTVNIAGTSNFGTNNLTASASAINVNGPLFSSTGTLVLQSTGALNVSASQFINATNGNVTLAADVKADGTGDDGVGTLTINDLATIYGANITLRGADQQISPTATVGSASSATTTPSTFIATTINNPHNVAIDSSGNIYIDDVNNHSVLKWTAATGFTTFATGIPSAYGLVFDSAGNLYVGSARTIRKVTPSGAVSVFATGLTGTAQGLGMNASGEIAAALSDGTVAKISSTGVVTNNFATGLNAPLGVAFDSSGNLYVGNGTAATPSIEKITPAGVRSTFVSGSTVVGNTQDIKIDSAGNVYNCDRTNNRINKFTPAGVRTTYASGITAPVGMAFESTGKLYVFNSMLFLVPVGGSGASTPPVVATDFYSMQWVTLDSSSNAYSGGFLGIIEKVSPSGVASNYAFPNVNDQKGIAFDSSGNLFTAVGSGTIMKTTPAGVSSNFVTTGLSTPQGIAFDASGNLYVANSGNHTISKITPAGAVSVFVTAANLGSITPYGLAFDRAGNLYVAGNGTKVIKKVTPAGAVSNFVTGLATGPRGLAFDLSGNLLAVLAGNPGALISINPSGVVTTLTSAVNPMNEAYGLTVDRTNTALAINLAGNAICQMLQFPMTRSASNITILSSLSDRPMNLGGTNNSVVAGINLTSAELARLFPGTNGTITFGDSNQTADITSTTTLLTGTPGSNTVVQQAATKQMVTNGGANFDAVINGTTAKTQYGQISTSSSVVLTNSTLTFSGSYTPSRNNSFLLINNTGSGPVVGTFTGLAEGATVSVKGTNLRITYAGGDGNDVALVPLPALTADLTSGVLTITDTDSAGFDNQLTVTVSGSNLVISDAQATFVSAPAGTTLGASFNSISVPLSSLNQVTINAGAGNDTINVQGLTSSLVAGLTINGGAGTDVTSFQSTTNTIKGNVQVTTESIAITSALQTLGNSVQLTSTDDITLSAAGSMATAGGNVTIVADSDANGSGNLVQVSSSNTITTNNGNLSITAASPASVNPIDAGTGKVTYLASQSAAALATQSLSFITTGGGVNADAIVGTVVDSAGSVYVTGTFRMFPSDFKGQTILYNGTNGTGDNADVFVAKFNSRGEQLWIRLVGSTNFDTVTNIALDSNNDVFLTGTLIGNATPRDFNGTAVTPRSLTNNADLFVAKLNGKTGAQIWFNYTGSGAADTIPSLVIDSNGNPIVAGTQTGTSTPRDFAGSVVTGYGTLNPYVAKLSGVDGTQTWFSLAGSTGSDSLVKLVLDSSGNPVLTGIMAAGSTPKDFTGTTITPINGGSNDFYVAKLSGTNGSQTWFKMTGSTGNDAPTNIAVDSSGNAFVIGSIVGSSTPKDFNGTTLTGISLSGTTDVFIAKLASSTGSQSWFKIAGGQATDSISQLLIDGSGNPVVGGLMITPSAVGFNGTAVTTRGGNDVFVAKLNSSDGSQTWLNLTGSAGNDTLVNLALDSSGNAIAYGVESATTPLLDFAGSTVTGFGGNDVYLAKLSASNGSQSWFKLLGSNAADAAGPLIIDKSDNVFVAGTETGNGSPVNFLGSSVSASGTATNDLFFSKLNSSGVQQWFDFVGGPGTEVPNLLTLDSTGLPVLSGVFTSTSMDFDPGTGVITKTNNGLGNGTADVFVWKPNSLGQMNGSVAIHDSNLDFATAGSVQIGDASAGNINLVGDITRLAASNVLVQSGGSIQLGSLINSAGGNITLTSGSGAITDNHTGVDFSMGSTGTLGFGTGSTLAVSIASTVVDTGYPQLKVVGKVDLTGASLLLSGAYVPALGEQFILIDNDGSDLVTGNFLGLANNSSLQLNGVSLTVNYNGGDGNDVVLSTQPPNVAPTAVVLSPNSATLAENTDTSSAIELSAISITDDGNGTNTLSLSGSDAASFEIVADKLRLKAGVALDFETKSSYSVRINVDDSTVGTTPDAIADFTLTISDVNEAPTAVVLSPSSVILSENANTSAAIELSTISITDDALGTNTLSLSGSDAASFEIVAGKLRLKAGVTLDYETKQTFSVTVNVDDTTLGSTPDASSTFTLNISNVTELTGIDIQKGQSQRSFVRYVDVLFDNNAGLNDLISGNRLKLTRYDLNGLNPAAATLPTPTTSGSQIQFDFGTQGIGGNRGTNVGDGYYELAVDMDGDGSFESIKHFFRLLGDANGDGMVDVNDKNQVLSMVGSSNVEGDMNGDGIVNATDTTAVTRAVGRKVKAGLTWDD